MPLRRNKQTGDGRSSSPSWRQRMKSAFSNNKASHEQNSIKRTISSPIAQAAPPFPYREPAHNFRPVQHPPRNAYDRSLVAPPSAGLTQRHLGFGDSLDSPPLTPLQVVYLEDGRRILLAGPDRYRERAPSVSSESSDGIRLVEVPGSGPEPRYIVISDPQTERPTRSHEKSPSQRIWDLEDEDDDDDEDQLFTISPRPQPPRPQPPRPQPRAGGCGATSQRTPRDDRAPQTVLDVDLNERFLWTSDEDRSVWYRKEDGCDHTRAEGAPSFLCGTCRRIDFFAILNQDETDRIPPLTDFIVLGPMQTLLQKMQCGFCQLVVRIATLETVKAIPEGASEADRRDLLVEALTAQAQDMYYLYPVRFKQEYGVPALFFARNIWNGRNSIAPSGSTLLPARHFAIRPLHKEQPRLGRVVKSDRIDVEWIKERLALCDERSVRRPYRSRGVLRAVDVHGLCIVDLEPGERYATLSYTWGKAKQMLLTRQSEASLRRPGGIAACLGDIPKTIQDSFWLVREIGERYLWVDALCVMQDDGRDMAMQIANMGHIYRESIVTIMACCGTDATYGLPGVHPGGRKLKQIAEVVGHSAMSNMLPGEELAQNSVWGTRAWTLQEKILSRRKLVITDEVVFWWCWHTSTPEDEHCRHTYWQPGERDRDMMFFNTEHDRVVSKRGALSNLDLYAFIISDYTRRDLTHQRDAERALQGIFEHLQGYFRGRFVHGLPDTELEDALLWCPIGHSERRVDEATSQTLFPSWSWLGWRGHAAYPWLVERTFPSSGVQSPLEWRDAARPTRMFTGEEYRGASYTEEDDDDDDDDDDTWHRWEKDPDDAWCFIDKAERALHFLHPVVEPLGGRTGQYLADPKSRQLRFRTMCASFTLADSIRERAENYNYEHKVFQLQILNAEGYSVGYVYTPDPGAMTPQQRSTFQGQHEFIIISRASIHKDPRNGAQFLNKDLIQLSRSMTIQSTLSMGRAIYDVSDSTSLDKLAYFDNRIFYKSSPWCLFNVLMIDRDEDGIAHRISVGRIHVGAFMVENPTWQEIRLE